VTYIPEVNHFIKFIKESKEAFAADIDECEEKENKSRCLSESAIWQLSSGKNIKIRKL